MPSTTPKDYVTLSARVPRALAETVTRYASQHRCSLSELLREGVEWRIAHDTPGRTRPPCIHDSDQATSAPRDVIHVLQGWLPVLQETIRQALQEGRQDVVHMLPQDTVPGEALAADQGADHNKAREEAQGQDQAGTAPSFDTRKYYLGPLCRHGHDYQGSGQSRYLRDRRTCYPCHLNRNAQGKRRKRAAQRQQQAEAAGQI